jgi:hypothetical protein
VGYQVEDILFQVGTGAADDLHLILANKLGQLDAHFGRAHSTSQRYHHFATIREVLVVAFGGINQGSSVEVAVVVLKEVRYVHRIVVLW